MFVHIYVKLHIQKHSSACEIPFLWSVRSGMGQLGDPPSEPHHRHLCPLRPAGKRCPVSINPVQHPGWRLTGTIPGKIKTDWQLCDLLHVIQTTEVLTDPFIIVLKCISVSFAITGASPASVVAPKQLPGNHLSFLPRPNQTHPGRYDLG